MTSNIQPFIITTVSNVVSFSVTCESLDLFTSATFRVDSFDSNGNIISRQPIAITNEQYLAWQNNDEYITILMASILGYTLTS